MTSTQPARGTRDFLPDDVRRRQLRHRRRRATSTTATGSSRSRRRRSRTSRRCSASTAKRATSSSSRSCKRGEHEASGQADLALRYDLTVPLARVVAQYQSEAAEVLQALPDSARVARRSAGARPVPRVLPVRHRRDRIDVAVVEAELLRGGLRRAHAARVRRLHDPPESPARCSTAMLECVGVPAGAARRRARRARQARQDRRRRRGGRTARARRQ